MKFYFLLLFAFISFACNKTVSKSKDYGSIVRVNEANRILLMNSDKKIAFLENDSENEIFGTLYCYDFASSKKIKIIESNSRLSELAWSPDGKKLLFGSSMDNNLKSDPMEGNGYIELFEFDFTSGKIRKLNPENHSDDSMFGYNSLCWTRGGIFYYMGPHSIYNLNEDGNAPSVIARFGDTSLISGLSVSRDGQKMGFTLSGDREKTFFDKNGIYDLQKKEITWLDSTLIGRICDWSLNNTTILIFHDSELYEYNLRQKKPTRLEIPGSQENVNMWDCQYFNQNEIIYRNNPVTTKDFRLQNIDNCDIRICNTKTKKITIVIGDIKERRNLVLYDKTKTM